jgi:hypothetical protein
MWLTLLAGQDKAKAKRVMEAMLKMKTNDIVTLQRAANQKLEAEHGRARPSIA